MYRIPMRYKILFLFITIGAVFQLAAQGRVKLTGRVYDSDNQPIELATVRVAGTTMGTMTDSLGNYFIGNLSPGMYRIQVSSVGYKTYVSPEFRISSYDYTLDIALEESQVALSEVSVVAAPFRSSIESPIAMRVIGVAGDRKSPGATGIFRKS